MDSVQSDSSASLQQAADKLSLQIAPEVAAQLEQYCYQLWTWNESVNLTRHTNFDLFARRDLLDSLKLAGHLGQGEEILDVGTGGGVPGLVLAILRPDLKVSLCDSIGKKAKVVRAIVDQLQLPVAVYPTRVQDVLEDLRFSSLVSRATGSLRQLLSWVGDHWVHFDRLLAIKGPRWVEERGEARHRGLLSGIDLRCLESYRMPGTESESVILSLSREGRQ